MTQPVYFPYVRGKQYELIMLREQADLFARSGFAPVVEPVKESLSGVARAVDALVAAGASGVLIVNPRVGDLRERNDEILRLACDQTWKGIHVGVCLSPTTSGEDLKRLLDKTAERPLTLVHWGSSNHETLKPVWGETARVQRHVFVGCTSTYRKNFEADEKVMIDDGFEKRTRNAEYSHEPTAFSDLHLTYRTDFKMTGFGDFLTVGSEYAESGGPAYAIALHLSYIDPSRQNEMFVHHFVSDRQESPADPAGKFLEALQKLATEVERQDGPITRTSAVEEFLSLYKERRYPGLGYVKKLSMQHHVETLEAFLRQS